jgi:hypothetical protein
MGRAIDVEFSYWGKKQRQQAAVLMWLDRRLMFSAA